MSRIGELKENIHLENQKIKDEIKELERHTEKIREIGESIKEVMFTPLKTYYFYNHEAMRAGAPFALCKIHLENQKIPPACTLHELKTDEAALFWGTMIPSCDKCRIENFYKGKERRNG